MSRFTDNFTRLRSRFNTVTGLTPTLTFGAATVNLLPNAFDSDPMFVGGGSADASEIQVSFLLSEMATLPEKNDVVTVAGYGATTGLNTSYQLTKNPTHTDGTVTLTLGNGDA